MMQNPPERSGQSKSKLSPNPQLSIALSKEMLWEARLSDHCVERPRLDVLARSVRRNGHEPNLACNDGSIDAVASLSSPIKREALAFDNPDKLRVIQAAQATGNEAEASPSVLGRQTDQRMRAVQVSLTDHGARLAKSLMRVASSSLEAAST
jgi:hypothetical protein